jgi:hypothetical protein
VVVGPDLLQLAVGLQERLLVPEPDVLDRGEVLPDVGGSGLFAARLGSIFQAVGVPGELMWFAM